MDDQRDMAVEGVTQFALLAASYRYIVELKDSKLSIRLEEGTTKKQWYKGNRTTNDFVSGANAIPDATIPDYIKCFEDALSGSLHGSSNVRRKLSALEGGGVRLELSVAFRALRSKWLATYTFDLDPVTVTRVDLLESKLRDQQDEMENLRHELRYLKRSLPVYAKLDATMKNDSSRLIWKVAESTGFAVTCNDGVVKVFRRGLYTISAVVSSTPTSFHQTARLLVNDKSVQRVYCNCSHAGRGQKSTAMSYATLLTERDEVAVECDSSLIDCSYLTIVRVHN